MKIDEKRFIEELYKEMYKTLYVYALHSLDTPSLAEEAVQETFRIACTKANYLCSSPNPQGWLMLTLKNTLHNMKRSQAKFKKLVFYSVLDDNIFDHPSSEEDQIDIDILFGDLSDKDEYKLIKKHAVEGKSLAEIADELDISLSACKQRMARARARLQKSIKRYKDM